MVQLLASPSLLLLLFFSGDSDIRNWETSKHRFNCCCTVLFISVALLEHYNCEALRKPHSVCQTKVLFKGERKSSVALVFVVACVCV